MCVCVCVCVCVCNDDATKLLNADGESSSCEFAAGISDYGSVGPLFPVVSCATADTPFLLVCERNVARDTVAHTGIGPGSCLDQRVDVCGWEGVWGGGRTEGCLLGDRTTPAAQLLAPQFTHPRTWSGG